MPCIVWWFKMTMMFTYLIIALSFSFLCSILEAVLLSTTDSYIQIKSKESSGGELLKQVKKDLDKSISAILTLNTFSHTIGAAGVGAEAIKVFGESYMVAISIVLTILILFLSEILPKTIGARYWRELGIPAAYGIKFITILTYPIVYMSQFFTKLFGEAYTHEVSREEIIVMSEIGEKAGSLREKEVDLIESLLTLRDNKIKDILTPRTVVNAFDENVSVWEAVEHKDLSHSRIPVYSGTIDDVVGVVFSTTIMSAKIQGRDGTQMKDLMKPVFKVSENLPVDKVLDLFIKRKEHLFVVVDKFGQTQGIVTLEDAIETLLGVEIMDEEDNVEDMQTLAKSISKAKAKQSQTN